MLCGRYLGAVGWQNRTLPQPAPVSRILMALCSVDGCNRQAKSLGYCGAHYQRFKKGKPFGDPPLRQEWLDQGVQTNTPP